MDVLSQVLQELRVRGSVFCYGPVGGDWGLQGGAPDRCLFHALVDGEAWAFVGDDEPIRVRSGDVVLLPFGGAHRLTSRRGAPATPLGLAAVRDEGEPFARLRLEGTGSEAWLVCGSLEIDGLSRHALLRDLPDVLVANTGTAHWLRDTVQALARQLDDGLPGSALTTSRLAEVLFVQTLAAWLQSQDATHGWTAALRDPVVGRALGLLHGSPSRPWTAGDLGLAAGASRSALYDRFTELVGTPPMTYLTTLRMTQAAEALANTRRSIAEISADVGYRSVPSFTAAFRRHHDVTPGAWRRAAAG